MRLSTTHYLVGGGALVGIAALSATLLVAPTDDAAPEVPSQAPDYEVSGCQPSELEVDGESWGGDVESVSPSGEYLVGDGDSMLWGPDDETVSIPDQVRDGLDKAHTVSALAVNSQGVVIGESYTKDRKELLAWQYHDGEVTELTAPSDMGVDGLALDSINDNGDIVGTASGQPLLWESGATEAQKLGEKGDVSDLEILNDRTVLGIGDFSDSDDPSRLHKWQLDGEREELAFSVDGNLDDELEASGDWILATVAKDGMYYSYRWNTSSEAAPSELDIVGNGIDSRGRVVGTDGYEAPAVETDAKVEELPIPEGASAPDYMPTEVGSHSGVIAGTGDTNEGETALMWRCDQ